MKTLHLALSDKSLWDGLKKSDSEIINSLLTEPVWQIAPKDKQLLTDSAVVNYTEDVIALGYFRQGKSDTTLVEIVMVIRSQNLIHGLIFYLSKFFYLLKINFIFPFHKRQKEVTSLVISQFY